MHPTMLQQVGHTLAAPNLGSHDLFSQPPKPSTLSVCVRTGPSPTAVFTCFDLQDLAYSRKLPALLVGTMRPARGRMSLFAAL